MKIKTSHEHYRDTRSHAHDWAAIDDETYDIGSSQGFGTTEAEAIADLMEQIEDEKTIRSR